MKDREFLDGDIEELAETMQEVDGQLPIKPGIANYVITRLVNLTMKPYSGWSYASLSKALAVFRDAEAEMRRRLLDMYEDKAIQRNGDIPEYE